MRSRVVGGAIQELGGRHVDELENRRHHERRCFGLIGMKVLVCISFWVEGRYTCDVHAIWGYPKLRFMKMTTELVQDLRPGRHMYNTWYIKGPHDQRP